VAVAADHPSLPGLPKTTRILLLILVVAVLAAALSQCEYRYMWWREGSPIQVHGTAERKNVVRHPSFGTHDGYKVGNAFLYE
jgi:hypothetical protein